MIENRNQKRIFLVFEFIPVKLPSNTGALKEPVWYFTNFNQDVTLSNNTYTHNPTIEVSEIVYDGGFNEPPVTITLGKSTFTDIFTSNEARARYRAIIREVTEDPITLNRKIYTIFVGFVTEGRDSVDGRNVVNLVCENSKVLFSEVNLGFPIQESCPLAFGNENNSPCGVTLEDKRLTGTLETIKGTEVVISGLTLPPPGGFDSAINSTSTNIPFGFEFIYGDDYFLQGYIEYGETRDTIIKWSKEQPFLFTLVKKPPDSWTSQTIVVVPGCTKTEFRCRSWNNLEKFSGYLRKNQ